MHQTALSDAQPAKRLGTACQLQNQLFVQSKEHFLLGIKGTVRRSLDSHAIHTNLDTDVIVTSDAMLPGPDEHDTTFVPHELFSIMERLCLGRRRMYFQFADQAILKESGTMNQAPEGWLTIREGTGADNFDLDAFDACYHTPKGYQRYMGTTPEIEQLRPRSPSDKK